MKEKKYKKEFNCELGMNHCVSGTSDCENQSVVDGYCKHYKPIYKLSQLEEKE